MPASGITPLLAIAREKMRIQNSLVREALGEFVGTAILLYFVVGGHIQYVIEPTNNSMQTVFGVIFGLHTAILIAGGASAQVNPAVTLGLAVAGIISWIQVPVLWLAQFLGAYVGAGMALLVYFVAKSGDPDLGNTFKEQFHADVFAPNLNTPLGYAFIDQIMGTSIFMMVIMACIDSRNMQVPKAWIGFFISLTIAGIAMCFSINAGCVLNPARDFSARLMALTVGYSSSEVMTHGGRQWWTVGFFGPLIGGCVGAVLYVVLIGAHLEDVVVPPKSKAGSLNKTDTIPRAKISRKSKHSSSVNNNNNNNDYYD